MLDISGIRVMTSKGSLNIKRKSAAPWRPWAKKKARFRRAVVDSE